MQHPHPDRAASFYLRNSLYKKRRLLWGWAYHLLLYLESSVFKQGAQDLAIGQNHAVGISEVYPGSEARPGLSKFSPLTSMRLMNMFL